MIAQQVFDDPYEQEEEEGSSARSLSHHTTSPDGSQDNLLQHLEAPGEETDTFPVPGTSVPEEYEPHSLGSSLYRLFSRSGTDVKQPSQSTHLSNLAEFHRYVRDNPSSFKQLLIIFSWLHFHGYTYIPSSS